MPGEDPTQRGPAQVQVQAGGGGEVAAVRREPRRGLRASGPASAVAGKSSGENGLCPPSALPASRCRSSPCAPACLGAGCLTDLRAAGSSATVQPRSPGCRPQTSWSGCCPREPPGAPRRLSFRTGSRTATVPRSEWKRFLWGPWKPDVKKESTRWREKTLFFCHWKEERYSTRNIQRSDCYVNKK
ncbi:unnamed protein product [Nyctereutes procyonoides]|uniref:(raccoon dog) hypothetical protein n=1 Tax=Nyctereutes procyonoides TaxID=34880 RepID=A0A811YV24_NYCPR|nr:unnamed protein product [Nyctereutes procyonoides]